MTRRQIAKLADVPVGELLRVEVAGVEGGAICIAHLDDGGVLAVVDRCTHEDSELSDGILDGDQIECPAHGSQFCVRTGAVRGLPAQEPVRTVHIEVNDGDIFLNDPSVP